MFRGITEVNIDDKGRMALPSKYRNTVKTLAANEMVCTIDTQEKCLLLYPLPYWEEIEQKLQSLPSFNEAARRLQRLLIGHATDLSLDNQGRLLLPQPLRDYADLKKQLVLVGQGRKFEIWGQGVWDKKRVSWLKESSADKLETMPAEMQNLAL